LTRHETPDEDVIFFVVLLLGGPVAASAAAISQESEKKAWLILAWASTVEGNLSLLGSIANLINFLSSYHLCYIQI